MTPVNDREAITENIGGAAGEALKLDNEGSQQGDMATTVSGYLELIRGCEEKTRDEVLVKE